MNKKILYTIFCFPLCCLIIWCLFLTYQLNTGIDVKVPIIGYDPIDLLSGHYILYNIDWDKTNCQQFPNGKCDKDAFCKKTTDSQNCRFYIPEKDAKILNSLFVKRDSKNLNFEVVYSYFTSRRAIAKKLLINGQDWKEYIKTINSDINKDIKNK